MASVLNPNIGIVLDAPRPYIDGYSRTSTQLLTPITLVNDSKTSTQPLTPTVPVNQLTTCRFNHRSERGKRYCLGCGTRAKVGCVWINPPQNNPAEIDTYIICRNPNCPAGRITQPRLAKHNRLAWFILETPHGYYYVKISNINLNKHNATTQLSAVRPTCADGIFLGTLHQDEHKCTSPDSDDSETDTNDELE